MEAECCGAPRSTCFCPQCGRKLRRDPLVELLAHCRRTEKQLRTGAAGLEKRRVGDQRPVHGKVRRLVENADRWKGWGDALAARIEALG